MKHRDASSPLLNRERKAMVVLMPNIRSAMAGRWVDCRARAETPPERLRTNLIVLEVLSILAAGREPPHLRLC